MSLISLVNSSRITAVAAETALPTMSSMSTAVTPGKGKGTTDGEKGGKGIKSNQIYFAQNTSHLNAASGKSS